MRAARAAVEPDLEGHYDVTMKPGPRRTMTAAIFKARCLKVLDDVAMHGGRVVITKRGRPVAELGPVGRQPRKSLRGSVRVYGDIVSPLDEQWEVDP